MPPRSLKQSDRAGGKQARLGRHSVAVRQSRLASVAKRRREAVDGSLEAAVKAAGTDSVDDLMAQLAAGKRSQANAVAALRQLLSVPGVIPAGAAVAAGAVDLLMRALAAPSADEQVDALWAATNLAAGEETVAVVPLVPQAVALLQGGGDLVREQAAWLLANVAGDVAARDGLLSSGAADALVPCVAAPSVPVAAAAAWALYNLAKGRRGPDMERFFSLGAHRAVMDALRRVPLPDADETVLVELLWLASALTADGDGPCGAFLDIGLADAVLGALERAIGVLDAAAAPAPGTNAVGHGADAILMPAVRVLGNMAACTSAPIVDAVVPAVAVAAQLLAPARPIPVQKETAYFLSNIAAGSEAQQARVFDAPGVLAAVAACFTSSMFDVRREIAYVLMNLSASPAGLARLDVAALLPGFVALLRSRDNDMIKLAMDFVERLLAADAAAGRALFLATPDALEALEAVQDSPVPQFYDQSGKLLETYFFDDDDE